jgi:uncharacterized protein YidB (DUF937 family)/outer membrane protein OmpA-like peptidoglycan-associated protein
MFDLIIKEAASKFGLGDKGGMIVQMLVAFMTNKSTGGLGGFMELFKSKGLGDLASSWLGGGAGAKPISGSQIESVLGGAGGLLGALGAKTGLGGSVVTSALGYLLPSVLGKLTPGGSIPTSLPADVMGFADQGKNLLGGLLGGGAAAATAAAAGATQLAGNAMGAAGDAAKVGGGGIMRWLPWVIAAAVAAWLLSNCAGKSGDAAKKAEAPKPAAAAPAPAPAPAPAMASGAPAPAPAASTAAASGAPAALSYLDKAPDAIAGAPVAKLYFDTGKVDLPADKDNILKAVIDYVKANAGTKAALSGYHDPTGDKAQNEELAKNRAKMVREALRVAGFGEDQILMVKPSSTTGSGDNKEARRVEVTVVK